MGFPVEGVLGGACIAGGESGCMGIGVCVGGGASSGPEPWVRCPVGFRGWGVHGDWV
jgi:hypothetical protein